MSAIQLTRGGGRTTYVQLTQRAAMRMAEARIRLSRWDWDEAILHSGLSMHADLDHALAHLGRTLIRLDGTGGRDGGLIGAHLLGHVERHSVAHPWDQPRPTGGPPGDISEAAVIIRSAADLWSTHHTPHGAPRSPEASRMRHPATLGAACREWRTLVALSENLANALAQGITTSRAHDAAVTAPRMTSMPAELTPPETTPAEATPAEGIPTGTMPAEAMPPEAEPAGTILTEAVTEPTTSAPGRPEPGTADSGARLLELPLARPGVRVGVPVLEELEDRLARLRHLAWTGAEGGQLPAATFLNLAVIGSALHTAVGARYRSAARSCSQGERALARAGQADDAARRWQEVATLVAPLRTPHPLAHPIQMERLAIEALIGRAATEGDDLPSAAAMHRIAHTFDEVATYNVLALTACERRGELMIRGSALPREALVRFPKLVEMRLQDRIVPVPDIVLALLCAAYRAISERRPLASPDVAPPAA